MFRIFHLCFLLLKNNSALPHGNLRDFRIRFLFLIGTTFQLLPKTSNSKSFQDQAGSLFNQLVDRTILNPSDQNSAAV